jgi:hypothetical protein
MDWEAINIGGNLSGITVTRKNRRYCMVNQRFPFIIRAAFEVLSMAAAR